MIAAGPIRVSCRKLEDGRLLMWGVDERGSRINPHLLKKAMFAWHAKSYYGTLIRTFETNKEAGVALSPYYAADYLASPAYSMYTAFRWSEEAAALQRMAAQLMDCIRNGWYAPSYEKWKAGHRGWKLAVPPSRPDISEKIGLTGYWAMSEWLDLILMELQEHDVAVRGAWTELTAMHPALVSVAQYADEEEWLEAIGWKTDDVPFRCGLRLSEPETDELWKLDIVLQDKKADKLLIEAADNKRIPASWRPFVQERLRRDLRRWQRVMAGPEHAEGSMSETAVAVSDLSTELAAASSLELSDEQAWRFLEETSVRLAEAGCTVFLPDWWEEVRKLKPKLKAVVKSSVGSSKQSMFGLDQLMQFDWRVAVGDLDLTEEQFRKLAAGQKRLLRFGDRWIQLDPAFLKQIQQIMKQVERNGLSFRDVLETHLLGGGTERNADRSEQGDESAPEEESLLPFQLRMEVQLNEQLAEMIEQLNHSREIPQLATSPQFQGAMRGYQTAGSSWLYFLRRFGMGACLADDMGLGKTVQFISYLLHVKETDKPGSPALLVCPTSVMGNWQKELERFAPGLNVYVHYGSQRIKDDGFAEAVGGSDLVLTTYALAHLDEAALSAVSWSVLCLDEAQNIKNVYTKQSAAVRKLKADHRIALTGTPMENRLTELWSIFDFMNPGYLGSLPAFTRNYVNTIEKTNDKELIGQVQRLVRPFMLRRTKKDPAIQLDLPEKNEANVYVPLTAEQGSLYEQIVQELFEKIDRLSAMERRGLILASITKLKQLCNHPSLLLKDLEAAEAMVDPERSNKAVRLLEMVRELREEGGRCLVFTQYAEMGHMLKRLIERETSERVYFLHGGVPKKSRDRMVAHFQDPSIPADEQCGVFILSLKAGGTGLNLTGANYVFHYDRWWNPAVENQATDRAYRIGQSRDVQVHKFVALGTLEERIDEMLARKQSMNQQIVSSENWITELSTGELKELFRLRKEWVEK